MSSSPAHPACCLGFLTVVQNAELGLLGGYLLLNVAGRPLEFHCTAPVKSNRTQQILYGTTLLPYLYGEQIGQTLLTRSKLTPLVVFTDSEPMLSARDFVPTPLVLVLPTNSPALPTSPSPCSSPCSSPFALARAQVTTARHYSSDQQAVLDAWPPQADCLDLSEPFQRIHEALDEAQKNARQAA